MQELRSLAEFLEVTCTDAFLSDVADKCCFDKLKNVQKQVSDITKANMEWMKKADKVYRGPVVYRKGAHNKIEIKEVR